MKKKIMALVLAASMITVPFATAYASEKDAAAEKTEESADETKETTESPVAGKKIAYIMYMTPATIFQMWSDSFTETAEKLGMQADTFFCNDSADTWKQTIEQCAQGGYDGLMVSHGGQEYAYDFLTGILEQYPDLKIATFDTPFKDANGEVAKIPGVVQFFQQDAGFASSLVESIMDMYPEKVEAGEPVNILQVQQGAGYNSPFDRRQIGYQPYEDEGKIKTVERIAPIDDQNATSSMRDVTAATLPKYGEGEIDGIWCCYDAYAQGVYQALVEANSDIPMVSVDICNEDPGDWMEIPSVIVTQEMVTSKDGINIVNLAEVAGEEYSDTSWMPTCDWMVDLLGH